MTKESTITLLTADRLFTGLDKLLLKRHITSEEIHIFAMENGDAFINEVADRIAGLIKKQQKDAVYEISVDYTTNLEKLCKRCKCDSFNTEITSENFPTHHSVKDVAKAEIKLFHFNNAVNSSFATSKIKEVGYRPAGPHELLALETKYPYLQREFPIVALGSQWKSPICIPIWYGYRYVVCLSGNRSARHIILSKFVDIDEKWDDCCRFAAVRE